MASGKHNLPPLRNHQLGTAKLLTLGYILRNKNWQASGECTQNKQTTPTPFFLKYFELWQKYQINGFTPMKSW